MNKHYIILLFLVFGASSQLLADNYDAANATDITNGAALAATTSITITANNANITVTTPTNLDLRGIEMILGNSTLTLPSGTQVDATTSFDAGGNDGVTVSVGGTTYTYTNNGSGDGTLAQLNQAMIDGAGTLGLAAQVAAGDAVLPVSLLSFEAKTVDKKVMLTWTVAEESGNEAFELSVSSDGLRFQPLQTVAGRGDAVEAYTYEVSDVPTFSGDVYYRLTQRDFSGVSQDLGIRSVRWEADAAAGLSVFPNPSAAGQMVRLQGDVEMTSVDLLGMNGQLVRQLGVSNGQAMVPGDVAAGVYLLRATGMDIKPIRLVIK